MAHRPRKHLGQHFLHDPGIIHRIVEAISARPGQRLLEIGPGEGAITCPILDRAGTLEVIELDRDLIDPLIHRCRDHGRLIVHHADALRFDFSTLRQDAAPIRVVGNLPYNISTPLIFRLLDTLPAFQDMHFLLQREVVDRIGARPGVKDYGRLSVMVQYRCEAVPLFGVGPGAFRPPPQVNSAFVRLTPHRTPPVRARDLRLFAHVVALAFGKRRKTLRNALRGTVDDVAFRQADIDPARRGETLAVAEFVQLTNAISTSGS